ncbi:unnamed protein product [Brassica rapa subsp. trilocularis]|uniref:(rape) hypothetical protein n=1 Tax=Brassica napus TaxID=3708 RepID=A0A816YFS9_BRANA|nr:unnamed protein product [Brassica napus]
MVAGAAVAAAAIAGRYGIHSWQAFKARPIVPRMRKFDEGGFQAAMTQAQGGELKGVDMLLLDAKLNESPPDQKIPFHHEMAQVPEFPSKLFFYCEVEPNSGGETPLVLSHVVYERMKEKHPEFVQRLEEHGLVYVRVLGEDDDPSSPIGRGWKSTFLTHDKNVAEERAAKLGMKLEWTEEGGAKTVMGPIPAIKFDESRNRKVWFNSMVAAYTWWEDKRNDPRKTVTFGDGEPLPEDIVHDCLRILEEECVAVPWQRGDVLLIDNWAVLHSRRPFESISEQATTSFYTIPLTLLFCI